VSRSCLAFLFLLLLIAFYYAIPINDRLLWQPDETRYAEISREMLATGNWAVPHFLDIRYFEKPVLGYWINNIGQIIFGESNLAVRAGAIFSTLLTALLLARFSGRCKKTALLTATLYLTLLIVYGIGTYAVLDPMIALCLAGAMVSFWSAYQAYRPGRKLLYYTLFGICCGLGVMTKGFIALAIPVVSILPWLITAERKAEVILYSIVAMISCALTLLPWAIAIAQQEPDFWRYFFWVEHIQRFAQSNAQHNAPFWYYLPWLLVGSLPWLGIVPGALRYGWLHRHKKAGYLLSWTIMPLLFFSLANGKLLTYLLPCFAPLALLMTYHLRLALTKGSAATTTTVWINIGFSILVIVAIIIASPWGPLSKPFWSASEPLKPVIALTAFASWLLFALLSLKFSAVRWQLIACCPLGLALALGNIIPTAVLLSKTPQYFLQEHSDTLLPSQFILSNDVGIAAGIAWQFKRSDVLMINNRGELAYGLDYPDAQGQFISLTDFPAWLATHRMKGTVSLLLKVDNQQLVRALPAADNVLTQGRMVLMQYFPR